MNANGQASHTTTFTTVGSHTITAAYNSTRSATPPAAPRPSRSHPLRRRPDRPRASVSSPAADWSTSPPATSRTPSTSTSSRTRPRTSGICPGCSALWHRLQMLGPSRRRRGRSAPVKPG
ncbi:hypothetical protein AB0G82_27910 [Streptomyces anulatus]|uniref:hypothetical protein n=1 Tax=Streptomyces anulatus TaxID=1892 RepID=UPI0033E7D6C6